MLGTKFVATKPLPVGFEQMGPEERAEVFRQRHIEAMEEGVRQGWWKEWDDRGPIDERHFPEGTFWDVIASKLKLFKSVTQARKNGWSGAVTAGEVRWANKKTMKVIIDERPT